MRNPPIEERCKGITSKNERCKVRKYRDFDYCKTHQELQNLKNKRKK